VECEVTRRLIKPRLETRAARPYNGARSDFQGTSSTETSAGVGQRGDGGSALIVASRGGSDDIGGAMLNVCVAPALEGFAVGAIVDGTLEPIS
jgi:hypothetical protein